jgi:translation initiation factor 1A
MNCIKFILKLFAPKESQIPYYSPSKVLSMDPRKTTTQQRKKARLEMKQRHFNYYNNERARRCIEPITYAEYNKMLKLKELSEEKYIESSENNRMSCFDKKKNNNQKELLFKNYGQEYAKVLRFLDKRHVALLSFDGVERTGLIVSKMNEVNIDDIVLINNLAHIIHKYTSYEVIKLKIYGELPCLELIPYDDYIKMLKLNELSEEEKNKEKNENKCMSFFDKDYQRELLFREDGQEYAKVLRLLGKGRVALSSFDGVARTGLIRSKMNEIIKDDIVLIGLREFQPDKADIIHKYTAEEARNLQGYGELPASAKINQTIVDMAMEGGDDAQEDMGFDFEDV